MEFNQTISTVAELINAGAAQADIKSVGDGIPVFDGSTSAYPVEARLKYREKSGDVSFWYELIRPDRVFKSAVADELAAIKEGTGLQVIAGTPGL